MRARLLIALLLGLSVTLSYGVSINGNFITYRNSGEIKPSENTGLDFATDAALADLLKHNFAVLGGQNI